MTPPVAPRWRRLGGPLLLAASMHLAMPAAADPVGVVGAAQDGFDRLVFAWPGPVQYSAERFGDALVIRFTRPIEGPVAEAAAGLGRFVRSARIGADGRSVVVELTGNHRMRTDRNGNQVIVDLMARGTDPPPAAPPAAAAPSPQPPPVAAAGDADGPGARQRPGSGRARRAPSGLRPDRFRLVGSSGRVPG